MLKTIKPLFSGESRNRDGGELGLVKAWTIYSGSWRGKKPGLGRGVVLSSHLLTPDDPDAM